MMLRGLTAFAVAVGGLIAACAAAVAETAPMTFTLRTGIWCTGFAPCSWIVGEGRITADTPSRFAKFIEAEGLEGEPLMLGVVVSSTGGELLASVAFGRAIRTQGFNTVVGKIECSEKESRESCDFAAGECYGACAYVFVGGVRRTLHEGSKLGVHQFSAQDVQRFIAQNSGRAGAPNPNGPVSAAQFVQSALSAYLAEMGVSLKLLEIAGRVPPDKVEVIADPELRALNVRTQVIAPTTKWELTPHGDGLRLVGTASASETGGSAHIVYRITFACTRASPGRVSVDYAESGNPIAQRDIENLRGWVTSGPFMQLDDRWQGEDVKRRFSELQKSGENTLHFSLHLTDGEFLSLARTKELLIGIAMPSHMQGGPGSRFELGGAHPSLALVLRNCEK